MSHTCLCDCSRTAEAELATLREALEEQRRVIRNSRAATNVLDTLDVIARRALEGSPE